MRIGKRRSGTVWPRGAVLPVESPTGKLSTREIFPPRMALARGRGARIVTFVALLGFGVLFAVVKRQRSDRLDLVATRALQRHQSRWFRWPMVAASWPGFPPQSRILPPALAGGWLALGFPLEAGLQVAGWGTGLVSFFVKRAMRRPRPTTPAVVVAAARLGGTSFPSGHVLNYLGVYGSLAFLVQTLVRPAAIRRPLVAALVALIALVGPSRIYLGHHWLTDVTASYLLGISYLLGLTAVYRRLKLRLLVGGWTPPGGGSTHGLGTAAPAKD